MGYFYWAATIDLIPVAKRRPRFARVGQYVRAYSDQDKEEDSFLFYLRKSWGQRQPRQGPISLTLEFGLPIPASTSRKHQLGMVSGETKHIKRPDLDNLVKFVSDAANGLLWRDDSQVCWIHGRKTYAERPYTWIALKEVR